MLTHAGRRLAKRYKVRFLSTCPSHDRKQAHAGDTDPWDRTDQLWPPSPKKEREKKEGGKEGEIEGGKDDPLVRMPGQNLNVVSCQVCIYTHTQAVMAPLPQRKKEREKKEGGKEGGKVDPLVRMPGQNLNVVSCQVYIQASASIRQHTSASACQVRT
jgi:hypothetical protein